MNIELTRGDTSEVYMFKRTDENDKVITTKAKKVWVTFKTSNECDKALFQKTLENGGVTFSEEDYYYRFRLEAEDTCHLMCGDYVFDIAIINELGEKKTLKKDCVLTLTGNCTHKKNEV